MIQEYCDTCGMANNGKRCIANEFDCPLGYKRETIWWCCKAPFGKHDIHCKNYNKDLIKFLKEVLVEMNHSIVFISTKEKMHEVGLAQYAEAAKKLIERIKMHEEVQ